MMFVSGCTVRGCRGERNASGNGLHLAISIVVTEVNGRTQDFAPEEFVGRNEETLVQFRMNTETGGVLYMVERNPDDEVGLIVPRADTAKIHKLAAKEEEVFPSAPRKRPDKYPPGLDRYTLILAREPLAVMKRVEENPKDKSLLESTLKELEDKYGLSSQSSESNTLRFHTLEDVLIGKFFLEYRLATGSQ